MERLNRDFFTRDVLQVAPEVLGCTLFRRFPSGIVKFYSLSEVEAYRGDEDRACHAFHGRTRRTEAMYHEGGVLYMYLIYGIYWMLNIVTAPGEIPQALLIRGLKEVSGPGRLTKKLQLDKEFYGEDLVTSERIWIENRSGPVSFITTPRINIDYCPEPWLSKPWRWILTNGN